VIDLDALANRTISPRHQECGVGFALRTMDPDMAAKFARAMANENVRHSELESALAEHHFPVAQYAIGRHRRGQCKCESQA